MYVIIYSLLSNHNKVNFWWDLSDKIKILMTGHAIHALLEDLKYHALFRGSSAPTDFLDASDWVGLKDDRSFLVSSDFDSSRCIFCEKEIIGLLISFIEQLSFKFSCIL